MGTIITRFIIYCIGVITGWCTMAICAHEDRVERDLAMNPRGEADPVHFENRVITDDTHWWHK